MLTERQIVELADIVNKSLDRSEELWNNTIATERRLLKAAFEETRIPGHPYLDENKYKSDVFVALMLDMRDSTKHLRQAISAKIAKVSQMQRVFYEISALLPTMSKLIQDENGAVTEYLGDGLLALFQLPSDKKKKEAVLGDCMRAARYCLQALKEAVNPVLGERYGLPPLEVGIGMAFSTSIISHFGLPPNTQVKVIGECIYFASQLSKGRNEIIVHENLERIWPTSKEGKLSFNIRQFKDFKGYIVLKK
jgi:class 3 adenylate cyclase